MKSDLIDLTLHQHHMTERAILVSDDGDREKAVWLPLSACDVFPVGGRSSTIVEVTLPERLAHDKGLI
jgi:hypothetical protein